MYDIVAQNVIAFFLLAYSALFIALVWWDLRAHLSLAVKKDLEPALARVVRQRVQSGRVGCSPSVMLRSALTLCGSYGFAHESEAGPAMAASIEGVVTVSDQQGQADAVPGVLVKLTITSSAPESLSATTDAEGRYRFTNLSLGTYTIEAHLDGFKPFAESVVLSEGDAKIENVSLELEKAEVSRSGDQ
jgi:Carboxypeptidase regulatory-like domain